MLTTTRRTAAAVTALLLISGPGLAACRGSGTTVATGPSMTSPKRAGARPVDRTGGPVSAVLARTATQAIHSGHLDVDAGPVTMTGSFEGDDLSVTIGSGDTSGSGATQGPGLEMRLVGGKGFAHLGDAWISLPFGDTAVKASVGTRISDTVDAVRSALEKATVHEPGTPMTVDGLAVTRYRAGLTGTHAAELFTGTGGLSSKLPDDARGRRIADYVLQHATVTLVGDVDADGMLRRLEVSSTVDTAGYPDCLPLKVLPAGTSIVLSAIDRPQGITAPPPDQVKDITQVDPSELLGGILGGSGGDPTGRLPQGLRDLADRLGAGGGPGGAAAPLDRILDGCPE